MKDENESRKRSIATAVAVSGVTATIYDAGRRYRNERERRAVCLRALVGDAAQRGDAMLVVEQDDSMLSWDNQRLIECTREARPPRLRGELDHIQPWEHGGSTHAANLHPSAHASTT